MADTNSIFYKIGQATKQAIEDRFGQSATFSSDLTVLQDLTVSGNLKVEGATSQVQITEENLSIKDNYIALSRGAAGTSYAKDQGIYFERGVESSVQQPAASFLFNESEDKFVLGFVKGTTAVDLSFDTGVETIDTPDVDGDGNPISYDARQFFKFDVNGQVSTDLATNLSMQDFILNATSVGTSFIVSSADNFGGSTYFLQNGNATINIVPADPGVSLTDEASVKTFLDSQDAYSLTLNIVANEQGDYDVTGLQSLGLAVYLEDSLGSGVIGISPIVSGTYNSDDSIVEGQGGFSYGAWDTQSTSYEATLVSTTYPDGASATVDMDRAPLDVQSINIIDAEDGALALGDLSDFEAGVTA